MIVLGSKALLHRMTQRPSVVERYYNGDYDVIMTVEEFTGWEKQNREFIQKLYPNGENKYKAIVVKNNVRKQYEIELGFEGTSSKLLLDHDVIVTDSVIKGFLGENLDTLNPLYQMLTKRSHLIYPVHFEKNMSDYQYIKKYLLDDFEINETAEEYFNLRKAEAKVRYSKFKTPKLNVSKEDFFSSKLAVTHYFVHDHIHEVMAHNDAPVYTMMQRDKSSAWCEKDMFFDLPLKTQIQCVQEEAYVIALERYIIPKAGDWTDHKACYMNAVKRICTTLCSGWFRDFALEYYPEVIDNYNPLFVENFINAVKDGEIKPLEGKEWSYAD